MKMLSLLVPFAFLAAPANRPALSLSAQAAAVHSAARPLPALDYILFQA